MTVVHDIKLDILSKALSEHLVKFPVLCSSAKSILELGAGTGLVGLTAAMLAAESRVILTDNNMRVLDLLQQNIDINFAHRQCESSTTLFTYLLFIRC